MNAWENCKRKERGTERLTCRYGQEHPILCRGKQHRWDLRLKTKYCLANSFHFHDLYKRIFEKETKAHIYMKDKGYYKPELGVIKLHLFSSSEDFVVILVGESKATTFSNLADFDLP